MPLIIFQVRTEVGYCRVWIRLALNEGLLASYLETIRRDNSSLSLYYKRSAFIRDLDLLEVAQRMLESIEHIRFKLDFNTGLLNYWSSTPLLLAGIWTPPMKSCRVTCAIDIAKTITADYPIEDNSEDIDIASSIGSMSSFASSQNNFNGISEDEAFKLILAKKYPRPSNLALKGSLSNSKVLNIKNSTDLADQAEEAAKEENQIGDVEEMTATSNVFPSNDCSSLLYKFGYAESEKDDEASSLIDSVTSKTSVGNATLAPCENAPFDALINSYRNASNFFPPANFDELLANTPITESNTSNELDKTLKSVESCETIKNCEHPADMASNPLTELATFEEQLVKLTNEKGLDQQNYTCYECGSLVGLSFAKFYVCGFTSKYFCCNCIAKDEYLIPAKIIHNWDLKKYPVCIRAADYLSVCPTLIDLKLINSKIYVAVQDMAQLQSLRVQLNLLRAYMNTCREPLMDSFHEKLAPREYLYEHIHQYSVTDLADIPNGTLARQLQKVVEFGKKHVVKCWLCTQKGFICEICRDPNIIFPFDLESTYRVSYFFFFYLQNFHLNI